MDRARAGDHVVRHRPEPVLSSGNLRTLLDTCKGKDFVSRRDAAIIYLFLDCGLRLAELAGLTVDDVDLRDRIIYVAGNGSNRSGPRRRAVRAGVKCAQALDRYSVNAVGTHSPNNRNCGSATAGERRCRPTV